MKLHLKDTLFPVLIAAGIATAACTAPPTPVEGTRVTLLPTTPALTTILVEPTAAATQTAQPPAETRPAATAEATKTVEAVINQETIIWDKAEAQYGNIKATVEIGVDNNAGILKQLDAYGMGKGFKFNTENNPESVVQVLKVFGAAGWQAWNNQHPEKQITADEFFTHPEQYPVLAYLRGGKNTEPWQAWNNQHPEKQITADEFSANPKKYAVDHIELSLVDFSKIKHFRHQQTTGRGGKTYLIPPLGTTSFGFNFDETSGTLTLYETFSASTSLPYMINNQDKYKLTKEQITYLKPYFEMGIAGSATAFSVSAEKVIKPKIERSVYEQKVDNSLLSIINSAQLPPINNIGTWINNDPVAKKLGIIPDQQVNSSYPSYAAAYSEFYHQKGPFAIK